MEHFIDGRVVWGVSESQKECLKSAIRENEDIINDIRGTRFDATVQPIIEKVVSDWIEACKSKSDPICLSFNDDTVIIFSADAITDDKYRERLLSKVPGYSAKWSEVLHRSDNTELRYELALILARDIFELEL